MELNKDNLLDFIVNELPSNFTFDYDDEDHGKAYLTDQENGKEYTLTITEGIN